MCLFMIYDPIQYRQDEVKANKKILFAPFESCFLGILFVIENLVNC